MGFRNVEDLLQALDRAISLDGDKLTVIDEAVLRERIDDVAYAAAFGDALVRDTARWIIWEAGLALGIVPASIHEMYMAVGSGEAPHAFTVPAINVRAMNFNTSRAIFRAANKSDVGALLFEIARSEMGYTSQRPKEYVASVTAAAIKEGFRGPLYIQGDHFQIPAKGYAADEEKEVGAVKELIGDAVAAGFFNIDIDTSTLVDLEPELLEEQQRTNYELSAELTRYVRSLEPEGITISLGGEIGEVGGHNSTVGELRAYMDGYVRNTEGIAGISKISVQTGTSHGGVVLPDGTLADVKVDFEALRELGAVARDEYGIGGAVQHGASTLPPNAFGKFPEVNTLEIHLATNFQNIIFDNLPVDVVQDAYDFLDEHKSSEWKPGKSKEQFQYSTRKKAIGPMKKQWWDLDESIQASIGAVLEKEFDFLFERLSVGNTCEFARDVTTAVELHRPRPADAAEETVMDVSDDLAD